MQFTCETMEPPQHFAGLQNPSLDNSTNLFVTSMPAKRSSFSHTDEWYCHLPVPFQIGKQRLPIR